MIYIQYLQGLCQSRLSTADYALLLAAFATTAVLNRWLQWALSPGLKRPVREAHHSQSSVEVKNGGAPSTLSRK
jgi:hypothetical protein